MGWKGYTVEQIIGKLRELEEPRLLAEKIRLFPRTFRATASIHLCEAAPLA
ncbi:MAG: hypothetical protein V2A58_10635 [Planctomycetota bacterium]